jgi:hypothetical protein
MNWKSLNNDLILLLLNYRQEFIILEDKNRKFEI